MFASALVGAQASAGAIAVFLLLFWIRGRQLNRAKWLRGAELASVGELARRVRPAHRRVRDAVLKRPAPYRVAGVPFPHRAETRHTIVSGTTGSGKTVLISDLVAQIRARGERCVLYDKMGSYTRSFFDPARDVLLNPLDARSPRWSPFLEARNPRDFDTMAAALIPQQKDTVDPFWVTAARQLFSNGAGVLSDKGVTENSVLVDHLLKTDLTALAEAMEGTVAQSIVDPENPKTALSVRAMLTAHLGALEVLADIGAPFSIRDWISDENRQPPGRLPVPHLARRPACILARADLHLARDRGQRAALPRPGRRPQGVDRARRAPHSPPGALAPARARRIAPVRRLLRARHPGDLRAPRPLRASNGAETVSGLCGTRVVLSAPDEDTARWSAASLGRAEVEEVTEGFSYGANTIRDGVSLTPKRELRPLAHSHPRSCSSRRSTAISASPDRSRPRRSRSITRAARRWRSASWRGAKRRRAGRRARGRKAGRSRA